MENFIKSVDNMKEYLEIKGISTEWLCDSLNITIVELEGFLNKNYFSLELLDELTDLLDEAEDFFLSENYIKPSLLDINNNNIYVIENKRNELKKIGIQKFLDNYIEDKMALQVALEEINNIRR